MRRLFITGFPADCDYMYGKSRWISGSFGGAVAWNRASKGYADLRAAFQDAVH